MERITVTVLKWEKYNPRKDIKHPNWFALSNRFLEDPDLFALDPLEFKALLYVFSQASQKNSSTISLVFAHAERICGIPSVVMQRTLEKMRDIGIVSVDLEPVRTRTQSERTRTQTSRDTTLQDKTLQNTTEQEECADVILTSSQAPSVKSTIRIKSVEEMRSVISHGSMATFVRLYSLEYVDREIEKAILWLEANPKKNLKTSRGWHMFIANWFDRGWGKHVTQLPTTPSRKSKETADEIADRLISEHERRQGA